MYNKARAKPLQNLSKNMKTIHYTKTKLKRTPTEQGESIEEQLRRLYANKQPIPQDVPPIYTPASEGVIGDYDIRHDRFDTAIEATNKFAASDTAKSAERAQYEPEQQAEQKTEQTEQKTE